MRVPKGEKQHMCVSLYRLFTISCRSIIIFKQYNAVNYGNKVQKVLVKNRTVTSHLNLLSVRNRKTTTYDDDNQGLGMEHAQTCGEVQRNYSLGVTYQLLKVSS